jgi:Protein of unknown function (DUF4232)
MKPAFYRRLIAAAAILAACSAANAAEGVTRAAFSEQCRVSQLRARTGQPVSEKTGQHTLPILLTNVGAKSCALDGYPLVKLFARGRSVVPFLIHYGGDQMVTPMRPRRVLVRPRHVAFAVINKYRCDLHDRSFPRRLELGIRGGAAIGELEVRIPAWPDIAYCGRGDPGSTISVSPFEPTLAAARR